MLVCSDHCKSATAIVYQSLEMLPISPQMMVFICQQNFKQDFFKTAASERCCVMQKVECYIDKNKI